MKQVLTKIFVAVLLFTFGAGLVGCAQNGGQVNQRSGRLSIPNLNSALGGADGSMDRQILSYNFALVNEDKDEIFINSIEPVLSGEIAKRLMTKNIKQIVKKSIVPGKYIEIKGEVTFDSKGLTKQEIASWSPFITGIKVSSEEVIQLGH